MSNNRSKGIITTYVLVFGGVFLILLGGISSFILLQLRQSNQRAAWNASLHIAEAGVNYYHWCLNNEVQQDCLTEKDYLDLDENAVGKFSLETAETVFCGETIQRKIISTGWTDEFPQIKRKISVSYARLSVGKYSYILDNNVWIGDDHEIRGPYHSNGGIRMDGENQSLVTSSAPDGEWICTDSFGCSSCPTSHGCEIKDSNCVCPGVFTTTNNSSPDLFSFPVTSFDFSGITVSLAEMKESAINGNGLYFGSSGVEGYRIVIDGDNVKVWKVLTTTMLDKICTVVGFKVICDGGICEAECHECQDGKCVVKDPVIETEEFIGSYPILQSCGLIFFEDDLWIGKEDEESNVKGKITIASADLIDSNNKTDVWLQGNINYVRGSELDGLIVIAQRNNLIGLYSPDIMELRGIFIAQNGFFGRNHYPCNKYSSHCLREKLEIFGSITSNGRVGTQWISGSQIVSGYLKRESYFDSNLVYNPPPFAPYIEPDFKIIKWEEIK